MNRLHEMFSTDTLFASMNSIGGESCCEVYVGKPILLSEHE